MNNKNALNDYNIVNLNMDILKIKFISLDDSWKADDVCSSFTRIYIPTSGEGVIKCNGKKISLVKGNVYIIPSSLIFSYECEKQLEKFYIHVSLKKPDGIDALSQIDDCLTLPCNNLSNQLSELLNSNSF